MKILSVHQTAILLQVQAQVDGKKFEYTSHRGGAWEVYDFPKSYKGIPRFLGHMPADKGKMLVAVLERDGWIGGHRVGDNGAERTPQRRGPTSEHRFAPKQGGAPARRRK